MTERHNPHLDDQELFLYLDRELELGEELAARSHLAGCERCQSQLEALGKLYASLDELEDLALGRDLSPNVLAEIRRTQRNIAPAYWLLATQLLVVIALLGSSWSYLGSMSASRYWDLAGLQTAAAVTSATTRLATQWAVVEAEFAGLVAWMQGVVQMASTSQAPPLSGWPWLVAATLLWVLGNGFLLQGNQSLKRKRGPGS